MNCNTCGAEVQTSAAFCHSCGAPVEAGGATTAPAPAGGPVRFQFEASALGLFGRSILLGLSFPFLFPVPWTLSWYWKWLMEEVRAEDGESLRFWGAAANAWKIVLLYVLMFVGSVVLGIFERDDEVNRLLVAGNILIQVFAIVISWVFTKWVIDHLELRGKRWRFDGSVWGFVGWNVLIIISIVTIIGWAWVMAGWYDWITKHIQDAGGTLRFVGPGHHILWRTLAMILFCLPIVTFPWAIRWYYAWLISQVELTPEPEA